MRIGRQLIYGGQRYELTLTARCAAPATAVYDLLADIDSHADWAGERQSPMFRLLSHDSPDRELTVGSTFTTTGRIPMIRPTWQDRSTVVAADRPRCFAFDTDGTIDWTVARTIDLPPSGGPGRGSFHHRYEIDPDGEGCRVTYRFIQTRLERGPLPARSAAMKPLTNRVMIPMFMARGLRNLLRQAEQRQHRRHGRTAS